MASTMVFRGQSDGRERERVPIALNRNVTPARRKTVFVENARAPLWRPCSIRRPAGGIGHDVVGSIVATRPPRIISEPTAMVVVAETGRSRVEVDPRKCADVIFGGRHYVLRAEKGTAPDVGYSNAAETATAELAAHVTAAEPAAHVAAAEAAAHVTAAEAAAHVTAAEAATASGVGGIDAQATT
jgi:hypothetical protein